MQKFSAKFTIMILIFDCLFYTIHFRLRFNGSFLLSVSFNKVILLIVWGHKFQVLIGDLVKIYYYMGLNRLTGGGVKKMCIYMKKCKEKNKLSR